MTFLRAQNDYLLFHCANNSAAYAKKKVLETFNQSTDLPITSVALQKKNQAPLYGLNRVEQWSFTEE